MYGIHGKDQSLCDRCARPSCLQPAICKNLNQDFAPLIDLYRTVDKLPYIKHAFVGSGIRYDLMSDDYARQLITRHVSGRLKVAPEHSSDSVLRIMRKPAWNNYLRFRDLFLRRLRLRGGLFFVLLGTLHARDAGQLRALVQAHQAQALGRAGVYGDRVRADADHRAVVGDHQDIVAVGDDLDRRDLSGINPYTREPIYVARTPEEKKQQNQYFFWYKKS